LIGKLILPRAAATFATIEDYRHFNRTLVAPAQQASGLLPFQAGNGRNLTPLPQCGATHDFNRRSGRQSRGRAGFLDQEVSSTARRRS